MEKNLKEKSLEKLYEQLLHLRSISGNFDLKIDDELKVTDAMIRIYQVISKEETDQSDDCSEIQNFGGRWA